MYFNFFENLDMLLSSGQQNKKKTKNKKQKRLCKLGGGGGPKRFILLCVVMKYIKMSYNLMFILILMDLFIQNGQFYVIDKKNLLKSIY